MEERTGAKLRLASGPFAAHVEVDEPVLQLRNKADVIAAAAADLSKQIDEATCAACVHCPHRKIECQTAQDPRRMRETMMVRATCSNLSRVRHRVCPDGFDLNRGAFMHSDPGDKKPYGGPTFHTDEGFVKTMMNHETLAERRKKYREAIVKASSMMSATLSPHPVAGPTQKITMPDVNSGWPVELHSNGAVTLAVPEDMLELVHPLDDEDKLFDMPMNIRDFRNQFLLDPSSTGMTKIAEGLAAGGMLGAVEGSLKVNDMPASAFDPEYMMNPLHYPDDSRDVPQTEDGDVW